MTVTLEIQALVDQLNNETCSVYEAVALSGVSHTTIRKRIKQERIRAVRLAGNWRIWVADLQGLK
jgi:hypothetical protein